MLCSSFSLKPFGAAFFTGSSSANHARFQRGVSSQAIHGFGMPGWQYQACGLGDQRKAVSIGEFILFSPFLNLFRCVYGDALANNLYPDVIAQTMDAEVPR